MDRPLKDNEEKEVRTGTQTQPNGMDLYFLKLKINLWLPVEDESMPEKL